MTNKPTTTDLLILALEKVAQNEAALANAVEHQANAVAMLAESVRGMRVLDDASVRVLDGMAQTFRRMQAFQEQMVKRSAAGLNARLNEIAALGRDLENHGTE